MFKALQKDYNLPESISEEQYKYIKEHKDKNPALAGFVGFGCSFGGKWFGGYARNKLGTNYALQSKHNVMKDMINLKRITFTCLDYKDVLIPKRSVIYADPPYANTTKYSSGDFNSDEFWNYMRNLSKDNLVFVSELTAPNDFKCIWEKSFTRTLDFNKDNQFTSIERLYVHNSKNVHDYIFKQKKLF